MKWKIVYHNLVYRDDRKEIDPYNWRIIIENIDKKLSKAPGSYGKPLRGKFKDFYKLAVGKYRVIYQIQKKKIIVWIVKIGPRKNNEVYLSFLLRKEKL